MHWVVADGRTAMRQPSEIVIITLTVVPDGDGGVDMKVERWNTRGMSLGESWFSSTPQQHPDRLDRMLRGLIHPLWRHEG